MEVLRIGLFIVAFIAIWYVPYLLFYAVMGAWTAVSRMIFGETK